jgi:hypothetical protein
MRPPGAGARAIEHEMTRCAADTSWTAARFWRSLVWQTSRLFRFPADAACDIEGHLVYLTTLKKRQHGHVFAFDPVCAAA